MPTQTVFLVTFSYVNSTMWVDVTDITAILLQETATGWSLHIYTDAGPAPLDQRFPTEAEALAEADVWVQRIEDTQ